MRLCIFESFAISYGAYIKPLSSNLVVITQLGKDLVFNNVHSEEVNSIQMLVDLEMQ